MDVMASIRNMLLLGALLVASSPMWCTELTGMFDEGCCGTTFQLRVLHALKKTGKPEKEVILSFYQGCPGHIALGSWVSEGWQKVDAKICVVNSTQCEPASAAKINIELVTRRGKHAAGSYSVDFSNNQHEEGRFIAKYRHEGPKYICE
jgi:hypothetical protein